ncbi:MAG: penicillin acylase family protein [Pseudomonadota bacterium]
MTSNRLRLNFKRVFITSLLSLIALLIAAWFGGRWYLERSVMTMSGQIELSGLEAEVNILFDARGIPRIYSQTDADAIRTLGWLHAGERLFQMELMRKVARGEIAEIIGPGGLESDVLHRQFGFARRIELEPPDLSPEVEYLLRAYVDGINQYIEHQPEPPSFKLLGQVPAPWQINDVLTLAYYQTWYPQTLVQRLAEAWRAVGRTYGDAGSEWLNSLPDWGLPSIPTARMTDASNTWAVAPQKSASDHALHAADPHLDYTMAPGLWYAAGLHSDESLNVLGVTPPGLPFVAMGHNGQIAFAFTVAPVDLFEWYELPLDESDNTFAIGPNGPESILTRTETFRVRGLDDIVEREIQSTARGIVLEPGEENITIMHWAGFDLPVAGLIENAFALNRAQDYEQFRAAASNMGALSVNWSYSDRDGNIGYVQSTPIPKRQHRQFYQTLDGTVAENYWLGYLEPEDRPFALNPDQHWLANANNQAATEYNGWPMPGFYKHLRMRRAADWLSQDRLFDTDDMRRMQLDQCSERALRWKAILADAAERSDRTQIADEFRIWDGTMAAESDLAGLFARWWQFLPQHLFEDSELDDWRISRTLLDDWMSQPPEAIEVAGMTLDQATERAFEDALKLGMRPLGSIQHLTIRHPMASAGILDRWLNLSRGPIPIGGGPGSLNVTYHRWHADQARLSAAAGASMRFVMDWADPDQFTLNLTMGQSGHPLSPHFDDFLNDFLAGQPWIVPFTPATVQAQADRQLRLQPATDLP